MLMSDDGLVEKCEHIQAEQGRRGKMNENRLSTAERVVQECFWGDYRISAQEILDRLDKGDTRMKLTILP